MFFSPVEIFMWFLSFILLIKCFTLAFGMLNLPCILGINLFWSWRVFLYVAGLYFFRGFCFYIHKGYWLVVSSPAPPLLCLVLVSGFYWPYRMNELGSVFPLLCFWRFCEELVLILLWKFGRFLQWSHLHLGTLFRRSLNY